jgi:hypothetical protein
MSAPDPPGPQPKPHRHPHSRPLRLLLTLVAAVFAFVLLRDPLRPTRPDPGSPAGSPAGTPAGPPASPTPTPARAPAPATAPARPGADDTTRIAELDAQRQSHVWVEVTGTVERVLRDDLQGSAHQRWILRLAGGAAARMLLVSHNLDLAPRVPFALGDTLRVRGEYIWNPQGGLMHWTHHDPDGGRPGGWIVWRGRTYR